MIVDVQNTDKIGSFIPSVNIKSIDINTTVKFSEITEDYGQNINIHYFLEDEITENFSFRWYDEKQLLHKLKIKLLVLKDKNLFSELLRDIKKIENDSFLSKPYKQNFLEFLLENSAAYNTFTDKEKQKISDLLEAPDFSMTDEQIKGKLGDDLFNKIDKIIESSSVKARDLIIQKEILLFEAIKNYEDIREIKPETSSNGDKKYFFFNKANFDISKEKNVYVICFSYLPDENGNIKVLGKINNDIVLQNDKLVKTFLYEDGLGNFSAINTDPQAYKKIEYANFKIKDLRILDKTAKIIPVERDTNSKISSSLYLTRSTLNEANGILKIDFDSLLKKSSETYKYFSKNDGVLSIIRRYSKIKSLKFIRKKITKLVSNKGEDSLDDFVFPIAKDSEKNNNLITIDNEIFSIKEIKKTNIQNFSNSERFFMFKDRTSNKLKGGRYFYAVQISVIDGSRKFIYNDILQGIQDNRTILSVFLRDCYENSLTKFKSSFFNEIFYNIFEQKYKEDISKVIENLVSSALVFYPEKKEEDLKNMFSSCLHPLSSNVELVEKILGFNNLLETFVTNLLTNIEKIDPYNVEIRQNNISFSLPLEQEITFKDKVYEASTPENIGIEYIDYNPIDIRRSNEEKSIGVPIYNKKFLDTRISREIRRFYSNEGADINYNGVASNDPYQKFLYNQTINSTKLSYFSPAYFDFKNDSYDFVSLRTTNNNFAYLESELRSKNLSYSSKDKFFNAFYALYDIGIDVNEINGKQRVISGTPDLKNPSIFEDYSNKTKISSKAELDKINFVGLFNSLASDEVNLGAFFDYYDKSTNSYILKQLTNSLARLTDEQIREIVKKMPLQIKSLVFKNFREVADNININIAAEKKNPAFYPKAKIDYNMIKKVEFLEKVNNKEEIWTILDDLTFNKLKLNSNIKYIICRLTNYLNEATGDKVFNEINLPVFNEYFLIDLETVQQTEETQDGMLLFKHYNVRTEDVNTFDKVPNEVYKNNLKKLMELF